jgi:type IV secretion system protein VirD4
VTAASRQPGDALSSGQPAALLFACCALFAACVATQYLAYRLVMLGIPRRWLGASLYAADASIAARWRWGAVAAAVAGVTTALFVRRRWAPAIAVSSLAMALIALGVSRGPVYSPTRAVSWMVQLRRVPDAAPAIESALYAFAGTLAIAAIMAFAARPARPAPVPSTSHGSARWSRGDHFMRSNGVILGRPDAPAERRRGERSSAALLRYAGDGHLLTVAPTRSGKGTGCVIPNLLTYPGSVLVTDPKGENHAVTARRRADLGQRVATLDPFAAVCGTDAFNPLDLIDPTSEDAVDDARLIADMLVVPDPRAREPHWDEEARGLLTGLTLHVAANAPPELRTLPHVRELLTLPPEPFALLLADMLESDAAGGLVRRSAARVLQKADRERSGVVSTAQSHTHFLDSPRMSRALGASTVDFAALKRGRLSVYLVLPPTASRATGGGCAS